MVPVYRKGTLSVEISRHLVDIAVVFLLDVFYSYYVLSRSLAVV